MLALNDVALDFAKMDGLVPAVVQHHHTGEILMVGFMNEAAWRKSHETGLVTFYSRTRQALWTKGETSGDVLRIKRVLIDCDGDTVVFQADPAGPTCHTGARSCFYREVSFALISLSRTGVSSRRFSSCSRRPICRFDDRAIAASTRRLTIRVSPR